MNVKALSIMRYQNDINTEHNMKSICRAAMAQWTTRLALDKREFETGKVQIFFETGKTKIFIYYTSMYENTRMLNYILCLIN